MLTNKMVMQLLAKSKPGLMLNKVSPVLANANKGFNSMGKSNLTKEAEHDYSIKEKE